MKRRWGFVTGAGLLLAGLLAVFFLSQLETGLPDEAVAELDRYLATQPGTMVITEADLARRPETFDPSMGQILAAEKPASAPDSPGLYSGRVIRRPAGDLDFPFPAQVVWCIWYVDRTEKGSIEGLLLVTQHKQLYGERWGLFQVDEGVAAQVGCEGGH